jgi:2,3-bisphosphoglycerate-independent phosphoglycerate mutase
MSKENTPKLITVILDGWGLNIPYEGNAVYKAKTPTFDRLWQGKSTALVQTSGEYVGLPKGQMGNSEVGHMSIGSGRVIYQDLVKINKAIEDGSLYDKDVLVKAIKHVRQNDSKLHIKGLYSPGGVHSHHKHIDALLRLADKHDLDPDQVIVHVITDGRDVPPKSAKADLKHLESVIKELGVGKISSLVGRYYAMDRDHNWDRTDQAFDLLTKGKGQQFDSIIKALEESYQEGVNDEFVKPAKIGPKDEGLIEEGDAVIFANFRADRPRQLVERFIEKGPADLFYATMTTYNSEFEGVEVVFPEKKVDQTLSETISQAGLKQLHITETVKYPHLTFFLNGKHEHPFSGEDRDMVKTYSDIETHDEKPQMRAPEIKEKILDDIEAEKHQFIITNFANGDMVGHTGNIDAAVKGCEVVDHALSEIIQAAHQHNYQVLILADHGNCEQLIDEKSGEEITAHSTNPVPLIMVSSEFEEFNRYTGSLVDIAPTILTMLHLDVPPEMTGRSFV